MGLHASNSLIAQMPETLRDRIFVTGTQARFQSGQMIHLEGDLDASLSIIQSGSVKISRSNSEGEDIVVAILGPGETYGEHPLFAGIPRTHDATAVTDVTIIEIPKNRFFRLMDEEPEIRNHALKAMTFRVIRTLNMLDDERRRDVTYRTAKFLVEKCERRQGDQSLQFTQSFIAESLDVSRVSINASLKRLKSLELIRTSYGAITVLDRERLKECRAFKS